jgi:hypothetical protein
MALKPASVGSTAKHSRRRLKAVDDRAKELVDGNSLGPERLQGLMGAVHGLLYGGHGKRVK